MTVCNFFLQGRCRYGDKCWNEHPGEEGGGGGGGGGFGNRVWVNPSQQKAAYIQPSSFSSHGTEEWGRGGAGSGGADWGKEAAAGGRGGNDWSGGGGNDWGKGGGGGGNDWGKGGGGGGNDWGKGGGGGGNDWGKGGGGGGGNDWGRGGGGGRSDNVKSSEYSFSAQNRFSALDTPSTFDRGGRGGGEKQVPVGEDDDDKKLEIVQSDMDSWESSGQWGFSCYSYSKAPLSGFTDLSPEELRLEYYSTRESGDLQGYVNGITQLLNQWRSRVQELKVMNPATRAALLAEINNPAPQASSGGFGLATLTGFGSSTSSVETKGFGAPAAADSFSFAAPGGGFGSSAAPPSSTGFGSALAAPTQPPSGFGATSPSTFSFAAPTTDKPAATSGFGSASEFTFSSTSNTGAGFGSGFGAPAPAAASGGFGAAAAPPAAGAGPAGGASDSLFSHVSIMTAEELNQFKAKRFTLGQIPLKPPPADMLVV
nr:nucleoporin NUP42 [Pseudochaenichthys georgianus]